MRRLWVTQSTWPTSEEVRAEAANAGACEIIHAGDGLPASLRGLLPEGQFGYFELIEPEALPEAVEGPDSLLAIRDRLVARLDNPSINTINEVKREVIAAFNDVLE